MAVIAWLGLSPGRDSFLLDGRDMGAINRRLGLGSLGSLVSCCRQYVAMCGSVWQGPVSHRHGDRPRRGTHTGPNTAHPTHPGTGDISTQTDTFHHFILFMSSGLW